MKKSIIKNNQGVSLLITLLIMAAFLSIAFGLSVLSLGEIRISRDVSKSVIAYYAADAGIECQMYSDRWPLEGIDCSSVCLSAGICFEATSEIATPPDSRTVKSIGAFEDVRRAIELTY